MKTTRINKYFFNLGSKYVMHKPYEIEFKGAFFLHIPEDSVNTNEAVTVPNKIDAATLVPRLKKVNKYAGCTLFYAVSNVRQKLQLPSGNKNADINNNIGIFLTTQAFLPEGRA